MSERISLRLVIEGRVQGVWFRGWMVDEARRLGLDGWVRNCGDDAVEALISGPAAAVATMVAASRRGPPGALVLSLATHPSPLPETTGFHRRPSV